MAPLAGVLKIIRMDCCLGIVLCEHVVASVAVMAPGQVLFCFFAPAMMIYLLMTCTARRNTCTLGGLMIFVFHTCVTFHAGDFLSVYGSLIFL